MNAIWGVRRYKALPTWAIAQSSDSDLCLAHRTLLLRSTQRIGHQSGPQRDSEDELPINSVTGKVGTGTKMSGNPTSQELAARPWSNKPLHLYF